ncbi:MAG: chemotaxis protein MotA [bacterium]|jgi:chemotaxis protein MotA
MDIASLVGTIGIFAVMIFGIIYDPSSGIQFGPLKYFIHIPSLIIVLLGSIVATVLSYPMDHLKKLLGTIGRVYKASPNSLIKTLVIIVDVAKIARKNVLAMEDALPSIENEYLRNGLRLVVDRVDRDLIVDMLQAELKYVDQQKDEENQVVKLMSVLSPAFGMIGTLIGLVILLQNLDDPSKIGPSMAVALITTLYGALFSNGFFMPWFNKLDVNRKGEKILYEMVRDGILFIEKNERPEFIEQDLMNYLSPNLKKKYEDLKFSSNDKGK